MVRLGRNLHARPLPKARALANNQWKIMAERNTERQTSRKSHRESMGRDGQETLVKMPSLPVAHRAVLKAAYS